MDTTAFMQSLRLRTAQFLTWFVGSTQTEQQYRQSDRLQRDGTVRSQQDPDTQQRHAFGQDTGLTLRERFQTWGGVRASRLRHRNASVSSTSGTSGSSTNASNEEAGAMADDPRLHYQLSQRESTVWQQGGPAALALQHQLAELHRQGGLGFASFLEVFHPDGILAAQHTAHTPTQVSPQAAQAPSLSQAQEPPQGEVPSPVRTLGRAEGTLLETSTVTAYQMSANESAAWSRGDHEARMVEANIGDALKDVGTSQPVAVLLDDGRAMYTHGGDLFQTFTASMSLLRDRLSALTSGAQVHLDFSVQIGAPRGSSQDAIATLQQRADQLTRPAPQRAQSQGMSY